MTTKKKLSNQIDPELQTFIDKIAAKYQPIPEVLQRALKMPKPAITGIRILLISRRGWWISFRT
ncbi:hypothetical protein [Escherichia coli]|uniref:hypothetical protein n=1 Tax=Escherichia coli TaxID=562 RepID=UPI0023F74A45|nr:hypothetical protein [Escherichia coli]MDF7535173.1 hypothetical protein [Escherichia coli]